MSQKIWKWKLTEVNSAHFDWKLVHHSEAKSILPSLQPNLEHKWFCFCKHVQIL